MLYLKMLKWLFVVFLLMSVLTFPIIYTTSKGSYIDQEQRSPYFDAFSLSNIPGISIYTNSSANSSFQAFSMKTQLEIVIYSDACYSTLFFFMMLVFLIYSKKDIKNHPFFNNNYNNYSVHIKGLG